MSALRLLSALLGLASVVLGGCTEAEVVAEFQSLQGSEDAVFVCRDGNGNGRPFAECPDRDATDDESEAKDLSIFALVSQTLTDEVAVVDVSGGHVVDVDPGTPGFGFLRLGGRPVAMAASPGGAATFVATAEVGRYGIFALPTDCLDAPEEDEPVRDLTNWPACRLASAPGELAVLVEPAGPDGEIFASCAASELEPETPEGAVDSANRACPVNLQGEAGPRGRRKLVVSLPDLGQLAVIDAQNLIDADAGGTFPDCNIEKLLPLDVNVPAGVAQALPPDLETMCAEVPPPAAPAPSRQTPQPAGFAIADDRLYVADLAAPVIHVIDTSSVCGLNELPSPLLPLSLREPERVVTTRRVAVSPLTPSGKRFVYAIDAEDQPGASVMVFDVSAGSTDRTPIVRAGSPELPGEKPDRLALASSAKDVTFAYRDLPYADPVTGVGTFGTLCDPNPEVSKDTPAGLARPSGDFSFGARPGLLRGLFGFVLLTNGTIAVVDVEDFDAPCRRPVQANTGSEPDFRGCAPDLTGVSYFTEDGNADNQSRTVTGEVSCRVVEPHRFRSATLAINDPDVGVRAPSLRGFPQLTLPAVAASGRVEDRPRLLGVPFAAGTPSEVFVGSTRYSTDQDSDDPLPVDPNSRISEQAELLNAVVLPPLQPRAYASEDTVTLTYEGSYAGDRTAGFFRDDALDDPELVLSDASLSYCNAGVYDEAAMAGYAEAELGLAAEQAAEFGQAHADYVQLTTALPDQRDSYWSNADASYQDCFKAFGAHDTEKLKPERDYRIVRAFADQLLLLPREVVPTVPASVCFPTANKYRLRGGQHWVLVHAATGFNHDVVASGDDRACTRSCNPLKKWAKSRAFEISSTDEAGKCVRPTDVAGSVEGDPLQLRVGCEEPGDPCVYDQTTGAVQLGDDGSRCIFEGLTERFALYRGREASQRDSVFTWQTTGGFSPLLLSLSNVSPTVSPQSMQFLQQPELLAVVDGAGLGLSLLSLDTFAVTRPSPFR